ncbi:MAG: sigma-70 family RNA polymerase sigma factor [Clostridiaceae bacterium]
MDDVNSLFLKHSDLIYRICILYLKNKTDAEDALQSTFLKYLEKTPVFNDDDHARAWFIVTAKNICRNNLAYWFNRQRMPLDFLENLSGGVNPNYETLAAIMALPQKSREIIYLYYYEGYTTEEIGQLLSRNHSTVRTQLVRGRELLKSALGEDDDEKNKS